MRNLKTFIAEANTSVSKVRDNMMFKSKDDVSTAIVTINKNKDVINIIVGTQQHVVSGKDAEALRRMLK